jgi:hypothetical protein
MCMLMAHVITCTQFKHDYVDAIDMWDMARRLGWIPWAKVWVKKVWGWGRPLHCETTTKSTPPPACLVCCPEHEKWGLCEEGSGPNLGENL